METYHRKRSKRSAIDASNDIMSLKRKETSSLLDGTQRQSPPLARQLLLDTDYEVPDEEVELGSVYEIYHKNLPLRTPFQLRSTRVVMVSEKTDLNVAIRYPSTLSLRTYFSNGITEMYPALDEKFVMGTKLARKVLLRQVPSQEFAEKKHLMGFWLVNTNSQFGSHVGLKNVDLGVARELKNNMIRWGVRRQVMFIGKHKELSNNSQSSSSFVQGEEEGKIQQQIKKGECQEDEEEVDDQEENDDETEEETHDDNLENTRNLRKRKKGKQVNHLWQVNKKPMKKCKKLAIRDPTDRWSKERYMAAELSLLEAMKEKKAMIGNPITRPALRVEARKRIGDTGLLDHLLKHVANKVAPGGTLRFRRSHNADGAMEYWLESADLLKIRKDAGVKDPFWIPPPGWRPGDSPVQDPIVAKEINHLKEVILEIKRDHEEELGKLRREIQELTSKKDQSQAIMVSEQADPSSKQLMDIFNFMLHAKSETTDMHMEKRNNVISDFLKNIQAEAGTQMQEAASTELITTRKESEKPKVVADKNEAAAGDLKETSGRKLELKAAKIERLKSGFRLCRPQGTFLWPNMVNPTTTCSSSSMSSSQIEDLLVVPTPPSVNSSTPSPQLVYHHHHHHHLTLAPPPLKPVPERRPLTVTLSDQGHPQPTTPLINLNA